VDQLVLAVEVAEKRPVAVDVELLEQEFGRCLRSLFPARFAQEVGSFEQRVCDERGRDRVRSVARIREDTCLHGKVIAPSELGSLGGMRYEPVEPALCRDPRGLISGRSP
jgi:hypothetical protein